MHLAQRNPKKKPRRKNITAHQHEARPANDTNVDYQRYLGLMSAVRAEDPLAPFNHGIQPSKYRPKSVLQEFDSVPPFARKLPAVCSDSSLLVPGWEEEVFTSTHRVSFVAPPTLQGMAEAYIRTTKSVSVIGLKSALVYSTSQRANVEILTRGQADNARWFQYRKGMVTASRFHSVYTRMKSVQAARADDASSLVRAVMGETTFTGNMATEYGRKHERQALKDYAHKYEVVWGHRNVQVRTNCGLHVDTECAVIGASPDAIVSCDCCGPHLVEVKCPSSIADGDPYEDWAKTSFMCSSGDDISLKRTHPYYTQVQGQMGVCQFQRCAFVVWTATDVLAEVIDFDATYWSGVKERLCLFFDRFLGPRLLGMEPVVRMPKGRVSKPCCPDVGPPHAHVSAVPEVAVCPLESADVPSEIAVIPLTSAVAPATASEIVVKCDKCMKVLVEVESLVDDEDASVGCDCDCGCDRWFHWVCVNFQSDDKDTDWYCPHCVDRCGKMSY
jgi:hypothetical protein